MGIQDDIAQAIRKADTSYFFEDYSKQAASVLKMLQSQGYAIVPRQPTESMVKAATEAITSGAVKPSQHVATLYQRMLAAAEK